jgi:hypothetical protein
MPVRARPHPSASVRAGRLRPSPSVSVRARPCPSVSVRVRPCPSVSVHVRPCPSVFVRVRPCPSVSVHVRPCSSAFVRARPCSSVFVRVRPCGSAPATARAFAYHHLHRSVPILFRTLQRSQQCPAQNLSHWPMRSPRFCAILEYRQGKPEPVTWVAAAHFVQA